MSSSKTPVLRPADQVEQWYMLNAKEQTLGRLATRIATLLRGKHQSTFTPHLAGKIHVVVINAAEITVSGAKRDDKLYRHHTGRPGSLRTRNFAEELSRHPARPLERAVERMLPDNKLRSIWMNHLHVYPAADHPHEAQQPTEVPNA
jgi:large subunit ribosomal protein L13